MAEWRDGDAMTAQALPMSRAEILTAIEAEIASLRCGTTITHPAHEQRWLAVLEAVAADYRRPAAEPRPLSEWHEDIGDVLWWRFPIEEPPYVGSPLDMGRNIEVIVDGQSLIARVGGWPGYHTHWMPLPEVRKP